MVLQTQTSLERIEESFNLVAREYLDTELCDGGRAYRKRGPLSGGMKIVMSPQESRHETAIRVMIGQIGALGVRVRRIEEKLGMIEPAKTDPTADDAASEEEAGTKPLDSDSE